MANRINLRAFGCLVGLLLAGTPATAKGQVVNNPAPNAAAPAFRISVQPQFTVGTRNDRSPAGDVWQVYDANMTAAGNMIVTHEGGKKVAVFNPRGQVATTIGRLGEGPGEFLRIDQISVMPGDTIALRDSQGRILYFRPDFSFLRQTTGVLYAECCLRDGAFLIRKGEPVHMASPENWQSRIPVWKWSLASGRTPEAAGPFLFEHPGDDPAIYLAYPAKRPISPTASIPGVAANAPFRRSAVARTAAEVIVYGRGDAFEYRVYSRSGALLRTVRAGDTPPALSARQIADARAAFVDRKDPEDKKMLTAALAKVVFPKTAPSYDRLMVQPDGTVWLRGYRSPYLPAASTPHWWVRFDPSGKMLGTMQLPSDIAVVRFLDNRVLVSRAAADGFTTLFVHAVESIAGR